MGDSFGGRREVGGGGQGRHSSCELTSNNPQVTNAGGWCAQYYRLAAETSSSSRYAKGAQHGVRSTTDWLQKPDMQKVRSSSTQHSRRRLRLCGIIIPFIKGQLQVVCCLANIEHANLAAKLLVRAWPSWFAAIAVALAKVVCFPHQIFRDPRTLCLRL